MSSNRGHRAGQCAPEVPRTRIRARGDLQERRTRPSYSHIQHPTPAPRPCGSLIQHQRPAPPARRQPHSAEIRRWRRQSVQMGRKICVCLSRCNPWRKIYSGVGNSSAQTVGDHAPREWEDPQAKRSGGMERSGSLCGRVAAPLETMYGRQCGSIGELCELANPAQVHQITSQAGVLFSAR